MPPPSAPDGGIMYQSQSISIHVRNLLNGQMDTF